MAGDDFDDSSVSFPSKVMHLFIKTEDDFFDIPGICLSQGYIPTVAYQEAPYKDDFSQFPPETAVWFKVQVLDSVAIDCANCCLSWSTSDFSPSDGTAEAWAYHGHLTTVGHTCTSQSSGDFTPICEEAATDLTGGASGQTETKGRRERRRQVTYSMYVTDSVSLTPDANLEKLYSSMKLAMKHNDAGHITEEQFHTTIRQLLHQHVLPSISLSQEDLPKLIDASHFQEKILEKYNQDMELKDKRQRELLKSMENQRTKFKQLLLDPSSPKWPYTTKMNSILLEHLEKDLKSSQHDQETAEISLKLEEQEGSSSAAEEKSLTGKRQKAAWCRAVHTELELSKKKLHDIVHKKFKISWGKANHNHRVTENMYLAMDAQLKELRNELKILNQKKLSAKSVYEAMQATIKDLAHNKESLGIDTGRVGDRKATDILRQTKVPEEWLTLAEQIARMVKDKQNNVGKSFHNFCGQFVVDKKLGIQDYQRRQELFAKSQEANEKTPPSSMNADRRMSKILKKRISKEKLRRQGSQRKHDAASRQGSAASNTSKSSSVTDSRTHSMLVRTFSEKIEDINHRMSWSVSSTESSETIKDLLEPKASNKSKSLNTGLTRPDPVETSTATWYVDREEKEELGNVTVEGLEDIEEKFVHVFVHHQGIHYLERSKDKIMAKIHQHFYETCLAIQKITKCKSDTSRKNIWLCYEPHVFESITTSLMQLYSQIFESDCETLKTGIPELTVGILQMEDSGVMDMIEGSSRQQGDSPGQKSQNEPPLSSFKSLPDFNPKTPVLKGKNVSTQNACLPVRLKPEFMRAFAEGFEYAHAAICNPIPLLKLRHLERCLMRSSEAVALHLREDPNHSTADHLLLSLQLLLCNLPPEDTTALYQTINFLHDYLPYFFSAGIYENILTHFSAAYATLMCCIKAKPGTSS